MFTEAHEAIEKLNEKLAEHYDYASTRFVFTAYILGYYESLLEQICLECPEALEIVKNRVK